jgi:hypothetical protein
MANQTQQRKKFYTGVSLDRDVVGYVDRLAREMGRIRTLTLNLVLGEHARRHGEDAAAGALDIAKEAVS